MRLDVLGLARALGAVPPAHGGNGGGISTADESALASSWLQSGAVLALHPSSSLLAAAHGSNLALVPLGGSGGGARGTSALPESEQQQKRPKQHQQQGGTSTSSPSSPRLSSHGLPLVVAALPPTSGTCSREAITALCFVAFARANNISEENIRRTGGSKKAAAAAATVPPSSSSLDATDGCLLVGTSTGHLQMHSLKDLSVLHRQRLHSNCVASIRARPAASGLEGGSGGGALASFSGPGPAAGNPFLDDEDVTVVFLDAVARLAAADVASVARLASSKSASSASAAFAGRDWRDEAAALPPLGMCKWQLSGVSAASSSAAAGSAADGGNGEGGGGGAAAAARDQRDGAAADVFRDKAGYGGFFGSQRVDGICLGPRPPSLREALEAEDDDDDESSSGDDGDRGRGDDEEDDDGDDDVDDVLLLDDEQEKLRRQRRRRARRGRRRTGGVPSRSRKAPTKASGAVAAAAAVGFGERSSGRALLLTVGGAPRFLSLHDAAEHSPRGTLSLVADLAQSAAAGLRAAARAAVFSGRPGGLRAGIRQWVNGGGADDRSSSSPPSSSAATTADSSPSPSRPQSASATVATSPSPAAAAAPSMSLSPREATTTPSRPNSAAASFSSPPPPNSSAVFEAAKRTEKLEPPPRGEVAPLWRCLADAEQRRAAAIGWWGIGGGGSGSGGGSTLLSPRGCLVAVADSLGRVLLADASTGVVFRVWKGYRGAQVAWLLLPSGGASDPISPPALPPPPFSNGIGGRKRLSPDRDPPSPSSFPLSPPSRRSRLLLVIYAPRRSLLEAWVPRPGAGLSGRVAALKCGGGAGGGIGGGGGSRARLLSPCPVLGLAPSSSSLGGEEERRRRQPPRQRPQAGGGGATTPAAEAGECWLLDCESGETLSVREAVASAIAASASAAAAAPSRGR